MDREGGAVACVPGQQPRNTILTDHALQRLAAFGIFLQQCYFFTNARISDPGETRLPLYLRQRVKLVEVMFDSAPVFAPSMKFLGLATSLVGEQRLNLGR